MAAIPVLLPEDIPRTEEPGRLWSHGSSKVWDTWQATSYKAGTSNPNLFGVVHLFLSQKLSVPLHHLCCCVIWSSSLGISWLCLFLLEVRTSVGVFSSSHLFRCSVTPWLWKRVPSSTQTKDSGDFDEESRVQRNMKQVVRRDMTFWSGVGTKTCLVPLGNILLGLSSWLHIV